MLRYAYPTTYVQYVHPTKKPKIDKWIEETREFEEEVPDIELTENSEPIFKGMKTVTRTVKERVRYTSTNSIRICKKDHRFALEGGRRDDGRLVVKCSRCPLGRLFVPGINRLENGKLLTLGRDF